MSGRGFTLVELLVATVVLLLVAGAALALVGPARAALDAQPAAIEMGQRLRTATTTLTAVARGGGGPMGGVDAGAYFPTVRPLTTLDDTAADHFAALWAATIQGRGGRGRLASDQASVSAPLVLSAAGCPATADVCGFAAAAVAIVFDDRGRFEVFEVAQVLPATRALVPAAPLRRIYATGAWVVEADVQRLGLRLQPDGSATLTRVTWAGASEPVVDGVVSLRVVPWGRAALPLLADDGAGAGAGAGWASYGLPPAPPGAVDPAGVWPEGEHCAVARVAGVPRTRLAALGPPTAVVPLAVAQFTDGPWCPDPLAADAYDADLFRLVRIDLQVRVEVQSAVLRGPAGRLFSRGGAATQSLRWVPDRDVLITVPTS